MTRQRCHPGVACHLNTCVPATFVAQAGGIPTVRSAK